MLCFYSASVMLLSLSLCVLTTQTFVDSFQQLKVRTPTTKDFKISCSVISQQCSNRNTKYRQQPLQRRCGNKLLLMSTTNDKENAEMEYKNIATKILSNFMSNKNSKNSDESSVVESDDETIKGVRMNGIDGIDFTVPKFPIKDIVTMATVLDYELSKSEWFVTGQVKPEYFSPLFEFQDPDVKLNGIEEYAKGVNKLFDQATSRAEIISTVPNPELGPDIITCTWRLSGKVAIGPGITIKPYIVYTDFTYDPTSGLIVKQLDRFDIPSWDILVSAFLPFLIGIVTAPPAPAVPIRDLEEPTILIQRRSIPIPSQTKKFGNAILEMFTSYNESTDGTTKIKGFLSKLARPITKEG